MKGPNAAPSLAALTLVTVALMTHHPAPLLLLAALLWPVAPRPRWPLVALAASAVVMNALFSWHGETVLWQAGFRFDLLGRPRLTVEALAAGGVAGLQLAIIGFAVAASLARVEPNVLARLMPGPSLRLATAVGLRSLPELADDARSMRHAMRVRGGPTSGLRGTTALLVPLVGRSLDRAQATATVLWARGGGARPTHAYGWRISPAGWYALVALAAWLLLWWHGWTPNANLMPELHLSALDDVATWTPLLAAPAVWGLRP